MVRQEAGRLLKKNKEVYNPLEVIESGSGVMQKLGGLFFGFPEELTELACEELTGATKESMGLGVSIVLQVMMQLIAEFKLRVNIRGGQQMEVDMYCLLKIAEVEPIFGRALPMVQKWERLGRYFAGTGQDMPFLRAYRGLRVKE